MWPHSLLSRTLNIVYSWGTLVKDGERAWSLAHTFERIYIRPVPIIYGAQCMCITCLVYHMPRVSHASCITCLVYHMPRASRASSCDGSYDDCDTYVSSAVVMAVMMTATHTSHQLLGCSYDGCDAYVSSAVRMAVMTAVTHTSHQLLWWQLWWLWHIRLISYWDGSYDDCDTYVSSAVGMAVMMTVTHTSHQVKLCACT